MRRFVIELARKVGQNAGTRWRLDGVCGEGAKYMGTSGKERRLFPRRLLEEEVYCYVADREKSDARSVDISVGGAFVEAQDEVEHGTPVALVFKQPDTEPALMKQATKASSSSTCVG